MGLVPGNRVLLRGANSPIVAACFLAVFKAGGIAVGTMPLLRAKRADTVVDKAQITHALCDARLADGLEAARTLCPTLTRVLHFNAPGGLEDQAAVKPATFDNFDTAADDTCLIAFTSGTTGPPKGTMHFHRDVLAACACWPHARAARGAPTTSSSAARRWRSPSGSAACCCFPMHVGAATVLIEKARARYAAAAIAQLPRDRVLHRADLVPRDGRAAAPHDLSRCASACRPARRCPPRRARCGSRPAASR